MANISLVTADKVRVVQSVLQMTLPAAEAITAGAPVRLDTSNGKFTNGNASSAAEARIWGIATKTVQAGEAVTAIRVGVMDGFDLSGLDYDANVFLSDTDGRLADAAGTQDTVLGRTIPGAATTLGTAFDKVLFVDCTEAEDSTLDSLTVAGAFAANGAVTLGDAAGDVITASGTVTFSEGYSVAADKAAAVTTADKLTVGGVIVPQAIEVSVNCPLVADQVDQVFFIANRAYQVTAIREVHGVAESAGTVNIQVERRQGTEAAAAGDALLTNNSNAGFDGTATANTVQTGTLTGTTANLQLAAGDRLGLNYTGDVAGELAETCVTVQLKAI